MNEFVVSIHILFIDFLEENIGDNILIAVNIYSQRYSCHFFLKVKTAYDLVKQSLHAYAISQCLKVADYMEVEQGISKWIIKWYEIKTSHALKGKFLFAVPN